MDLIDSHFHVFRQPRHAVPGSRYLPAYGAPLADWSARAGACGIGRGVLVQTSFLGADNSELLDVLAEAGGRLRGVAVLAPGTPAEALAPLQAAGVRGLRLNLAGASAGALAALALPVPVEALLALGWHVELHTDAGALPGVLARIDPRLPVVLDHFGKPASDAAADAAFEAVAVRLAAGGAPVHVKLSAAYRLAPGVAPEALARHWRALLGPERLLWGSDWPCTNHEALADYGTLFAALATWLPDGAERHRVLRANAEALYWA